MTYKVYADELIAAAHPEREVSFWRWRLRRERVEGRRLNLGSTKTRFVLSHVRRRQGRWS